MRECIWRYEGMHLFPSMWSLTWGWAGQDYNVLIKKSWIVPMDEIPDLLEVKKTRNIILKMEKSTILKSNQ